jgi:hypothetical protein
LRTESGGHHGELGKASTDAKSPMHSPIVN